MSYCKSDKYLIFIKGFKNELKVVFKILDYNNIKKKAEKKYVLE